MAEKHHYLARTYLEGFTVPGEKVLWACRGTEAVFRVSPRKFAARRDYYAVPQHWLKRPPREIEEIFGVVETSAAPFLKRALGSNAEPTPEEAMALLNLATIQYARVPAQRDEQVRFTLEVLSTSAALVNRATNTRYAESGYNIAENTDLGMMLSNISAALHWFSQMSVIVVYFPSSCVITGDNPVGLHYEPDLPRIEVKRRRFSTPDRPYDPSKDALVPKRLHMVSMPLNRRAYLLLAKNINSGVLEMPVDHVVWGFNADLARRSVEIAGPGEVLLEAARRSEAPLPTEWPGGLSGPAHDLRNE